ncbi:sigma-54-dependent Fis family transcriptional regulator [Bradyrhizobium sp. Leo170]|uniref:sigma-54-dependent Fis family transcriptional regulator n=1 Tax=Bradyrhizobium sp. Leo170 TaxID=1571199 RepID=UPI00102E803E|nr:sigma-54-dependent Fis family transcriptional regulator [Bradyrhizobium sp. Leo170]TAI64714.1 sigma-54-dependent Fis family transcriptional regulator [Bradyrhizobium sp. Leo170]
MFSHSDHIREIESVSLGAATNRDDIVVQSWLRCINQHRLDPAQACEAYIVPDTELREHRQQSEELISIARSGLENLFRQVAGQNYVLLLSDRQGVTVEFLGDPLFDNNLRKAGLYLGSEWSESRAGTCAVGACIESGDALSIHQTDHFDNTHTPLSCTAAPIYDVRGALAAVLDISLLSSPIKKASQNLALHLVTATVRRIELANLMAQASREWVLRFARSPEFLDVDPEAAISIDGSGRIIGMTNGGAKILARSVSRDWRQSGDLIGQPISRFFEIDINDLPNLTRQRRTQDRLVFARDGNALFAHAIEPNIAVRAPTSVRHEIPASLRDLGRGDPQIGVLQVKAAKLAARPLSILIQGETGTGKEYLARAIHDSSAVKGRFVAVNCAAIPEQLIEGELFGHVPGAFTGANAKGRKGLIEEADGGTLFLDEIGDMPLPLQSRLLRVLAEKELMPIGATRPKPVDVRVISASHRMIETLVKDGRFREDLFYRLNAATLFLPSLRGRSDFAWLLGKIVERHRAKEGSLAVSPAALHALEAYAWPGNIRELDNVISVAAALCQNGVIEPHDLPEALLKTTGVAQAKEPHSQKTMLETVLAACGGNVSEAARRLGVDRSTVHRQIKRYGLNQPT